MYIDLFSIAPNKGDIKLAVNLRPTSIQSVTKLRGKTFRNGFPRMQRKRRNKNKKKIRFHQHEFGNV